MNAIPARFRAWRRRAAGVGLILGLVLLPQGCELFRPRGKAPKTATGPI